ncbi:MAG: winged helix-turn-helix domain-containing protein [Lachnospiraceae bacterium]
MEYAQRCVIENIIANAIKYTQKGSEIVISAKRLGNRAVIRIADNGPGIADEIKPFVFDIFYSGVKNIADSRRSLGLGLPLCKSIITAHGEELHLTPIEYKLLCLLSQNVGKVLTHTYLTQKIWGQSWENNVASLRVFMATLRKKIEKNTDAVQYIQTHVGVGYRMLKVE